MRSHKYNANRLEVAKIVPKGVQSRGPRVPEIVAVGPAATMDSHAHLDNPKKNFYIVCIYEIKFLYVLFGDGFYIHK